MEKLKLKKAVHWDESAQQLRLKSKPETIPSLKPTGVKALIVLAVSLTVGSFLLGSYLLLTVTFEWVPWTTVAVFHSPASGYEVKSEGLRYQGFRPVTIYDKYPEIRFREEVVFKDGTRGEIRGRLGYRLPERDSDLVRMHKDLVRIHKGPGLQKRLEKELVEPLVQRVIRDLATEYTGPEMRLGKVGNIGNALVSSVVNLNDVFEARISPELYRSYGLDIGWIKVRAYIP